MPICELGTQDSDAEALVEGAAAVVWEMGKRDCSCFAHARLTPEGLIFSGTSLAAKLKFTH